MLLGAKIAHFFKAADAQLFFDDSSRLYSAVPEGRLVVTAHHAATRSAKFVLA
jgi:hypothetical protein